jgi:hypothetical protein
VNAMDAQSTQVLHLPGKHRSDVGGINLAETRMLVVPSVRQLGAQFSDLSDNLEGFQDDAYDTGLMATLI